MLKTWLLHIKNRHKLSKTKHHFVCAIFFNITLTSGNLNEKAKFTLDLTITSLKRTSIVNFQGSFCMQENPITCNNN